MVLLKVSYKVPAHQVADFEEVFQREVVPLIRQRGMVLKGVWRSLTGNAGEFLELWEFASVADWDRQWRALMGDTQLLRIFEKTGPMVHEETFQLFEPILSPDETA